MSVIYTSSVYSKNKKKNADGITYDYYLTVDLQSQDIVNNRSTVLITLYLKASKNTGTLMWSTSKANAPEGTITVDGTTYNSSISVGSSSSDVFIDDGKIRRYSRSTTPTAINEQTLTINHNSDGTKYLPLSFNWVAGSGDTTNYYPTSFASNGATITLPAIPRQSIINCDSSVTLSDNTSTFSYSVKSYADYYHVLSWTLDGTTTNVWTSGSPHRVNNTTETLTIGYGTLLNALQTAATKTLTFTLKTYSDSGLGTLIGTTTKAVSVTIDSSVYKPTLTINSISPNSTPISGKLVAGHSTATVSFTSAKPQGTTGLTIYFSISKGSMANATSTTVGSGTVSTNTLPASESNYLFIITAYAVDSRGIRSATVTSTSGTVYAYSQPVITASVYRVTANGSTTADDAGDYVYITYSATCSSVGASNSIQSIACTYNGNTYANGTWAALSVDSQGSFVFTATDLVMTATRTIVVPTAKFPLDLYDDGTAQHLGVGLAGAVAEADKVKSAKDVYAPNVYAGNATENISHAVSVSSNAGEIKMFANAGGSATRGLWLPAHGTGSAKAAISVDTDNNVTLNGNATTATDATYATRIKPFPSANPTSSENHTYGDATMFHYLSTGNMTTGKPSGNGYITEYKWNNTTSTKGALLYLQYTGNQHETLGVRGSSSSTWNAWAYADLRRTLWTGSTQGGDSISLDCSDYSRLRVWVHSYALIFPVDIDLTKAPGRTRGDATGNTAYRGSAASVIYTTNSSLETHFALIELNAAKTTVYIRNLGYYKGTTYANRNSNSEYYAYKIEGYL